MESLWVYETTAAVANALPEADREVFATLMAHLARRTDPVRAEQRVGGVRRWLRDAGWEARP